MTENCDKFFFEFLSAKSTKETSCNAFKKNLILGMYKIIEISTKKLQFRIRLQRTEITQLETVTYFDLR